MAVLSLCSSPLYRCVCALEHKLIGRALFSYFNFKSGSAHKVLVHYQIRAYEKDTPDIFYFLDNHKYN
jgi:hypothetical protein